MTRRFSQMLMAFLFPNKTQQHSEISQANNQRSNKSSTKLTPASSLKRRTRSNEVRI